MMCVCVCVLCCVCVIVKESDRTETNAFELSAGIRNGVDVILPSGMTKNKIKGATVVPAEYVRQMK